MVPRVAQGNYARTIVSRYPAWKPAAGETIQLVVMRKIFLTFMTLIRLANPDPIMSEETVSVVDGGIPSCIASSTVPAPSNCEKNAYTNCDCRGNRLVVGDARNQAQGVATGNIGCKECHD